MDEINPPPPRKPAVGVCPLQLDEARTVVCEVYEAVTDDLSVRTPVRAAIVALANAKADLRESRERLINGPPPADPVRLRGEMVATAAYLVRAVVQLGLPAPARIPGPVPAEPPPATVGPLAAAFLAVAWTLATAASFWWAADRPSRVQAAVTIGWGVLNVAGVLTLLCSGRGRDRGHS